KNTDYGEAGMSGLYNMNTRSWDKELLAISEVDEEKLLIPAENVTPVGNLTAQAAEEMGLTTETQVILGSWDNYACAIGGGVRKQGTFVTCLGTAGWVGVNSDKPLISPDFMSNVAYVGNNTYFTSVHSHSACVSYEWVLDNMCADLKKEYGKKVHDVATELAREVGAGADGVFFLPSMFSGNTFYSDSSLAGSFLGLKMHHTHGNIIRAAMEGMAFDLMMGVDFFKMMGVMSDEARLIGGGANNDLWMQMLASMFGVKMIRPQNLQHIGALGAALIAGVGAGLISSLDVANDVIRLRDSVEPVEEETKVYQKLLPIFKHFYESLMPVYKELSKL
ncbi:MAG: FGGY-family carbohydrate kinase, partial [Christensenella sp.]